MKRTIQFGKKYDPVFEWLDKVYDKEESSILTAKLLSAYKTMKEKNMDLLMLSELLQRYDMDIYKLIQILENQKENLVINVVQPEAVTPLEDPAPEKPASSKKVNSGVLGLGIDLSS